MSSGVQCASEVVTMFEELKLRHKYTFITFKIEGDTIVPESSKTAEEAAAIGSNATWAEFTSHFPEEEGRFGVYDLEYTTPSDGDRNKLVFFMWAPDTAKIKSRMIYASSKQAIRQRLDGINVEVQATDAAELSFEAVFEKVAPKGASPVVRAPKA